MEPRKTKKRRSPVRPSPSKPPLIVTRHPLPVAPPILSLTSSCPARAWPVATSASRLALRLAPPHPPPSPSVRLAAAASLPTRRRRLSSRTPLLHLASCRLLAFIQPATERATAAAPRLFHPHGPIGDWGSVGNGPGGQFVSGPRRGTTFGDQGRDGDRSPGPDPPRCHPNQ